MVTRKNLLTDWQWEEPERQLPARDTHCVSNSCVCVCVCVYNTSLMRIWGHFPRRQEGELWMSSCRDSFRIGWKSSRRLSDWSVESSGPYFSSCSTSKDWEAAAGVSRGTALDRSQTQVGRGMRNIAGECILRFVDLSKDISIFRPSFLVGSINTVCVQWESESLFVSWLPPTKENQESPPNQISS